MRIVCISDTHLAHEFKVPEGDLLIHAGDLTGRGTFQEIASAGRWLASLPHPHKIVIAGNHDFLFEKDRTLAMHALGHGHDGIIYVQDEIANVGGFNVLGTPWTPRFYDWAFQLGGKESKEHWKKMERYAFMADGIDILVTHGPPYGIMDKTYRGDHVGDRDLLASCRRLRPKLHVFGHIHNSHGYQESSGGASVNAAVCDEYYDPMQGAIVVDWDESGPHLFADYMATVDSEKRRRMLGEEEESGGAEQS